MASFNKGDTVQLKSGGPVMTVEDVGEYTMSAGISDGVKCVWFDGKKRVSEVFDVATLRNATPA